MKGLVFDGSLRLAHDLPLPQPAVGEALIRVRMAGICGTDLQILRGYRGYQGILGHEFAGEVVQAADSTWRGKRVCGEINVVCGDCDMCRCGRSTHCRRRTVVGIDGHAGVFAEYVTLPVANLHEIPDSLSDEEAVFVEPLAAACEILHQVDIVSEALAIVVGDGRLGSLCAQVLTTAGARTMVVGRNPEKLERLRRLGLEARLLDESLPSADLVVDATGTSDGFLASLNRVRPRGTLVLKSTVAGSTTLELAALAVNEITIVGSRCGPFEQAIELLTRGAVRVLPLVDRCFKLTDGVEALAHASRPGVIKVLISMRETNP